MTELPVDPRRTVFSILAISCMSAGAWMMWGFGGFLFVFGLFMAIDLSSDEALERITKTTRGKTASSKRENQ